MKSSYCSNFLPGFSWLFSTRNFSKWFDDLIACSFLMIDCPVNVDQKSVKANMKFLKHVEFNLVDVSGCGVLRRRKSPRFSKIRGDRVHTLLQLPSRFLDFISQPCIVMAARSQIRMSALHMLSKSSSSNIIDACAVSLRTSIISSCYWYRHWNGSGFTQHRRPNLGVSIWTNPNRAVDQTFVIKGFLLRLWRLQGGKIIIGFHCLWSAEYASHCSQPADQFFREWSKENFKLSWPMVRERLHDGFGWEAQVWFWSTLICDPAFHTEMMTRISYHSTSGLRFFTDISLNNPDFFAVCSCFWYCFSLILLAKHSRFVIRDWSWRA